MKRAMVLVLLATGAAGLFMTESNAQPIQPEYYGQFGYAEETALRPYKWMWIGVKGFFFRTREGFVRGNMKTPVVGSVQTIRGVRRGTIDLAEHTWSGALYRSIPPRGHHRNLGRWNTAIESDLALRNISDLVASELIWTWYAWPVQKFVDHYPLESDEKVDIRLEHAERVRDARRTAEAIRQEQRRVVDETPVQRAQRRYLQDTRRYGRRTLPPVDRVETYRGDLRRLAR